MDEVRIEFIDDENPRWRVTGPTATPEQMFYVDLSTLWVRRPRWQRMFAWLVPGWRWARVQPLDHNAETPT